MVKDISASVSSLISRGILIEPSTNHYFSDGVCVREMIVPAGTLVLGAAHKTNHLTTLVSGVMQVRIGNESKMLNAPCTFEALDQSRKVGLAYTECVVHNIIPTDSKDIDEIERMFTTLHEDKFVMMLAEHDITLEQADAIAFNKDTYSEAYRGIFTVASSKVHGKGLFVNQDYIKGATLGKASLNGIRTELGRYVNHSIKANIEFDRFDNVVTTRSIKRGEELLVDYSLNLSLIKEIKCQQQ